MDWTTAWRRWFPVAVALCLFVACSGDEEPQAGELPPGVVEGSPSIGIAPVTSPSPSRSTPAAAAVCPNQEAAAGDPARQIGPAVSGDVDGDGISDRVHVAGDQAGTEGCSAFVVVETAAGIDAAPAWEIGSQGGLPAPRIHGFADLDGSGGDEVLVDEAAGASTQFVGAFIYTDDGLERVTVPGGVGSELAPGAENLFAYGGSVGHLDAADCAGDGTIVISTATPSSEQGVYEIERRFFVFDGTDLERGEVKTERAPISRMSRFPEYSSSPFGSC